MRTNFTKLVLAIFAMMCVTTGASAQGLTYLSLESLGNGTKCYLYNVGHKLFVNGAGAWNTQAVMSPTPLEVELVKDGDNWVIKTYGTTISNKNLGTDGSKWIKRENAAGADMLFVDGNSNKAGAYLWKITRVGQGSTYTCKIQANDATGDTDACMGVSNKINNTQTNSCVYGPYFNQTYNETDALWAFVDMNSYSNYTWDYVNNALNPYDLNYTLAIDPSCGDTDLIGWNENTAPNAKSKSGGFGLTGNFVESWNNDNKQGDLATTTKAPLPSGTYRLTVKIGCTATGNNEFNKDNKFFLGSSTYNLPNTGTSNYTMTFYCRITEYQSIRFGFHVMPYSWVAIDDIKLEAVGGLNTLVPSGEHVYAEVNCLKDNMCQTLQISDGGGNGFNNTTEFTASTVNYARTLVSGKTTTVCLPFGLTADEAAQIGKFYSLSGFDGKSLTFTAVTDGIEANKPYLVVPSVTEFPQLSEKTIPVTPTDFSTAVSGNATMTGTVARTTLKSTADETIYAYNNGEFVKVSETNEAYLPAFRAYIKVSGTAGAKLGFNLQDTTTGIDAATVVNKQDEVYTIGGVKVRKDNNRKGIYIENGKKVLK